MTPVKHTLDDLIGAWCRSQESQGLARNTTRNRELHLRAFMALVGNIQIGNVAPRHVDHYFEHCMTKARPLQPNSLNKHKESLDVFFGWAVSRRYIPADCNPMSGRRKFRVMPKDRLLIPAADFPRLLDGAPSARDRVIVALGLYLFPRQSEIRSMRIKDVDLQRGYVHMKNHKSSTVDDMPICVELDGEIRRWLTFYGQQAPLDGEHYFVPAQPDPFRAGGRRDDAPALVPTRAMGELHDAVQRTLIAAGYAVRREDGSSAFEGSHTLRRSGARALYDKLLDDGHDGAIRVVQAMLHHASVTQTEVYLGMKLDQARRDKILRGKRMFAAPAENVLHMIQPYAGHQG